MQLRSGTIYQDSKNITMRKNKKRVEHKYRAFRIKCKDFIGELDGVTCHVNTVYILYRMYNYIDSDIDNISSYLNLQPGLGSFLTCVVNNIPIHIHDIISCERNDEMGVTWNELTGFTAIEIARTMYELRLNVRAILDVFGN